MILLILDDVNRSFSCFFKAMDMLLEIDECFQKVSSVVLLSDAAAQTIKYTADSWNQLKADKYGPSEQMSYAKGIIRNLITVFEMDLEEQKADMKRVNKKQGWKVAGAIGLGVVGIASIVLCPVAAVVGAAAAETAIGATIAGTVAGGGAAVVGKAAIEGANDMIDNADAEEMSFKNGVEQDTFFINMFKDIELKYFTGN